LSIVIIKIVSTLTRATNSLISTNLTICHKTRTATRYRKYAWSTLKVKDIVTSLANITIARRGTVRTKSQSCIAKITSPVIIQVVCTIRTSCAEIANTTSQTIF
jgi:hypothetical protein